MSANINTQGEHTGRSVNYYTVHVLTPTSGGDPYTVECNDVIEALGMNYAEANVFKSIWRICAAKNLAKLKKGNSLIYDAEKAIFFSERVLHQVSNNPLYSKQSTGETTNETLDTSKLNLEPYPNPFK